VGICGQQSHVILAPAKHNVVHAFRMCFSTGDRTTAYLSCDLRYSSISLSHRKRRGLDNRTIVCFGRSVGLD
jgi:hypothetical protein